MVFSVFGFSLPVFVIGYLLIYVLAAELGWFPVQGYARIRDGGENTDGDKADEYDRSKHDVHHEYAEVRL